MDMQRLPVQIEVEKAQNYDLWPKILKWFYRICKFLENNT